MIDDTEAARIAAFIEGQNWTFAKTMPTNPHEYIVRGKGNRPEEFDEFVRFIRRRAEERIWGQGNRARIYLYWTAPDGRRYWTMGWPVWSDGASRNSHTYVINRVAPDYDTSVPVTDASRGGVRYSSPDGRRPQA